MRRPRTDYRRHHNLHSMSMRAIAVELQIWLAPEVVVGQRTDWRRQPRSQSRRDSMLTSGWEDLDFVVFDWEEVLVGGKSALVLLSVAG
jgi:hypothetical protein